MDSLTQIVLGAAVAEATLGKKIGNKALLWGGIAGTIPDLDVFYIKLIGGGAIEEIVLHRGISHSITFAVLMAPVLGWLVHWLYRKKNEASFLQWTNLFFWAIFTHPLLDCLTTYGTQLFLPFSDYRVTIASVFIVDFFYTVPFLLSVIAVSFINRTNGWRRKINYLGLALSSAYLLVGFINKQVATSVFERSLASDPDKKELAFVGVTPLNIVLWYAVAETDSAFHIAYYSFFDESKDVPWVSFKKNHHLIAGIENEYGVERLRWFSDQLFVLTQPSANIINFYTLKFGRSSFNSTTPEESFIFHFQIIRKEDGELAYESIRDTDKLDVKKQLGELYDRMMGD